MGGHTFGELATNVRGIITYKLSPYELKPFAGLLTHSPFNMFKRVRSQIFYVAPPFIASYILYDWAQTEHARSLRKNPKDYENDV